MDLHCPASHAPALDAELPSVIANPVELSPGITVGRPSEGKAGFAHPDADVRMAEWDRENKALDGLEAEITQLWGHINAATAQFLSLLAEFDRREGLAQHGLSSCAHWESYTLVTRD